MQMHQHGETEEIHSGTERMQCTEHMTANPQNSPRAQAHSARLCGWKNFFIALSIGAALWSIVLPWLRQRPAIAEHIEQMRAKNIDPSARYYSDLETLPPIVHRLERLHTTNHAELWSSNPTH